AAAGSAPGWKSASTCCAAPATTRPSCPRWRESWSTRRPTSSIRATSSTPAAGKCRYICYTGRRISSRNSNRIIGNQIGLRAMSHSQRRAMLLLIVLSGLIIALCMGLRQTLGLFMRPMTVDLGISAASFGFAIALQNIVWGLSQPFVGAAADRYGARPVLIVTALVYAAGLILMGFSSAFPGALHVAGFLAGIGTAGTGFGILIG